MDSFSGDRRERVVFTRIIVRKILGLLVLGSRLVGLAQARHHIPWEDLDHDPADQKRLVCDLMRPTDSSGWESFEQDVVTCFPLRREDECLPARMVL